MKGGASPGFSTRGLPGPGQAAAVRPTSQVASIAFLRPLPARLPNVAVSAFTGAQEAVDPAQFFGRTLRHCHPHMGVADNPAQVVRMRHDAPTVARFLAFTWWGRPVGRITRILDAIRSADLAAPETAE